MIYCFFFLPELGQHLSGLIWAVMLVSAAIVITLPRESGVRTFVASTILRMIFSVGPEPTLLILGTITVSHVTVLYLTLTFLTWRIWWANNASRWQMGFNSAYEGLKDEQQNCFKNITVIRIRYGPRSCQWAGTLKCPVPSFFLVACKWRLVGQFAYCCIWMLTESRVCSYYQETCQFQRFIQYFDERQNSWLRGTSLTIPAPVMDHHQQFFDRGLKFAKLLFSCFLHSPADHYFNCWEYWL